MVNNLKSHDDNPDGVGIGIAGQVEYGSGIVRGAPNLGWRDYPLGEKLRSILSLPIVVDSDVRVAANGEWQHGAGRGTDNLICTFVGTGVGGGIITEGRLLHGANNTAGEVGHMTVERDGLKCRCRNHGCPEACAGGWAMAQ